MASARRKRRENNGMNDRRFTVRGVRREPVDIAKLSKALIGLVMAEEERKAEAEHQTRHDRTAESPQPEGGDDA